MAILHGKIIFFVILWIVCCQLGFERVYGAYSSSIWQITEWRKNTFRLKLNWILYKVDLLFGEQKSSLEYPLFLVFKWYYQHIWHWMKDFALNHGPNGNLIWNCWWTKFTHFSIKIEIQKSKPKLPFLQFVLASQPALTKDEIESRTTQ